MFNGWNVIQTQKLMSNQEAYLVVLLRNCQLRPLEAR
jgi:hypothetical protein